VGEDNLTVRLEAAELRAALADAEVEKIVRRKVGEVRDEFKGLETKFLRSAIVGILGIVGTVIAGAWITSSYVSRLEAVEASVAILQIEKALGPEGETK